MNLVRDGILELFFNKNCWTEPIILLFRIHKRDEDGDEFGMENFVYPCRKYATEKYEPTETQGVPFLPSIVSKISRATQCNQRWPH